MVNPREEPPEVIEPVTAKSPPMSTSPVRTLFSFALPGVPFTVILSATVRSLPIVTSSGNPIVITLVAPPSAVVMLVVISLLVPAIFNALPVEIVCCVPLSPRATKVPRELDTLAVVTDVTRP